MKLKVLFCWLIFVLVQLSLVFAQNSDPHIIVLIPEEVLLRPVPDPAAETEIMRALINEGYRVVDLPQVERLKERDAIKGSFTSEQLVDLRSRLNADVLVTGEAFSEEDTVISGINFFQARLEVKAIDLATGQVFYSEAFTGPGKNVTPSVAAKDALQTVGAKAGEVLPERLRKWIDASGTVSSRAYVVKISNVPSFSDYNNLLKNLRNISDVNDATSRQFDTASGVVEVKFSGSQEDLAVILEESLGLTITGISAGEIRANFGKVGAIVPPIPSTTLSQSIPEVTLIGVKPIEATTNQIVFTVAIFPKGARGELITSGVTLDNFSFRNITATRIADNAITGGNAVPTRVDIIERQLGENLTLLVCLDSSGSMERSNSNGPVNDPDRLRVQASKALVNQMGASDKIAVTHFHGSNVGILQDFTSDKTLLKGAIDRVTSNGGTPLYDAVLDAVSRLNNYLGGIRSNAGIIILTDGEDSASKSNFETVLAQASASSIPIFTIGLGNGVDFSELQTLAVQTGGEFATASQASDLQKVFDSVGLGIVEGRVQVTGVGTFPVMLPSTGNYRVVGELVTNLSGYSIPTPFAMTVTVTH